jgi:hypothetical protein
VIPPLPKKKGLTQAQDDYFIGKRLRSYNQFLSRISLHTYVDMCDGV